MTGALPPQGPHDAGSAPGLLDLALGQGRSRDLDELRSQIAVDPRLAIEFAETRGFLEQFRALECEPSASFASRMERLGETARRRRLRREDPSAQWLPIGLVAAAVLFAALTVLDPLSLRRRAASPQPIEPRLVAESAQPLPFVAETMSSSIAKTIEATQRLAPGTPLATAWTRFESSSAETRLAEWLSPRNAVGVLRLEREMRATATERRSAMRDSGLAQAIAARVDGLARGIVAEAEGASHVGAEDLSLALRALVHAGPAHDEAASRLAASLAARLPSLHGGELAMALLALAESDVAVANTGRDAVEEHGRRFVASVLDVGDEVWSRRRPRMLQPSEPAYGLAAGGRFLRFASEFGIDATKARAVRLLLCAHLLERRGARVETPDVPTALVYGFDDLLANEERAGIERSLRSWRPEALVPDYVSLQQFASTRSPEQVGFARWQLDLRRVAALPVPGKLADRAALCLCLADCLPACEDRGAPAGL